jgi:hypothetical protein
VTKKDFEVIADVIKGMPGDEVLDKSDVALAFAKRLKLINPSFKTDLFLRACGVKAS